MLTMLELAIWNTTPTCGCASASRRADGHVKPMAGIRTLYPAIKRLEVRPADQPGGGHPCAHAHRRGRRTAPPSPARRTSAHWREPLVHRAAAFLRTSTTRHAEREVLERQLAAAAAATKCDLLLGQPSLRSRGWGLSRRSIPPSPGAARWACGRLDAPLFGDRQMTGRLRYLDSRLAAGWIKVRRRILSSDPHAQRRLCRAYGSHARALYDADAFWRPAIPGVLGDERRARAGADTTPATGLVLGRDGGSIWRTVVTDDDVSAWPCMQTWLQYGCTLAIGTYGGRSLPAGLSGGHS